MLPQICHIHTAVCQSVPEHAAVKALSDAMETDAVKAADYAKLLYAQAQLMAQLPLEDPAAYTELVCKLMK